MKTGNFDVIVVGAGAAGLTAAIALARRDFKVLVLEAALQPGAENWSGCVYFAENLAHPEVLGPEGVERLPWERRLVERGKFVTDGYSHAGFVYRDAAAFRDCYTVLRPAFDRGLAEIARDHGVALLPTTTAEGLIRQHGRVVGVSTNRGPVYAPLTFLAEGDAAHLVTKEGYERFARPPKQPHFLLGVKQIIELDARLIEQRFSLAPGEGAAHDLHLRNGTLRGRPVSLNVRGFIYTNRQSVSLGFFVPLDELAKEFQGDPQLLLAWLRGLPEIRRLIADGRPGPVGAKLVRSGGAREIPYLIDHGLAVGGAASGIGVDFPHINFTGPATGTGLLLARAAADIRDHGGSFSAKELRARYLQPLIRSHYWADTQFLRAWPRYVAQTHSLFDSGADALLGTLNIWTRSDTTGWQKWWQWVRLMRTVFPRRQRGRIRRDARRLARALDLPALTRQALGWRTLLEGGLNTLRDVSHAGRRRITPAGTLRYVCRVADRAAQRNDPAISAAQTRAASLPAPLRQWRGRLTPVLARAARQIYENEPLPLRERLRGALETLFDQTNFLDLAAAGGLALAGALSMVVQAAADRFRALMRRSPSDGSSATFVEEYLRRARAASALPCYEQLAPAAHEAESSEDGVAVKVRVAELEQQDTRARALSGSPLHSERGRLHDDWQSGIARVSDRNSHILLRPADGLEGRHVSLGDGLEHVCPAGVFERRTDGDGRLRPAVHFDKCIKCEACWRAGDLVDWARDGRHRVIYPTGYGDAGRPSLRSRRSSANSEDEGEAASARETTAPLPHEIDFWSFHLDRLRQQLLARDPLGSNERGDEQAAAARRLVAMLDRKAEEFTASVLTEPRAVDPGRARWLETLAGYLSPLADELQSLLRGTELFGMLESDGGPVRHSLLGQIDGLLEKIDDIQRHTWDRRFFWAAADCRQIRGHHLVGLRRTLALLGERARARFAASTVPRSAQLLGQFGETWRSVGAPAPRATLDVDQTLLEHLAAERLSGRRAAIAAEFAARLEQAFTADDLLAIDRGEQLSPEQLQVLAELIERVPPAFSLPLKPADDRTDLAEDGGSDNQLHPLGRKVLLEELSQRDPALAHLVSGRLLARDVVHLAGADLAQALGAEAVPVLAAEGPVEWLPDDEQDRLAGEKLLVPAAGANWFVLVVGNRVVALPPETPAVRIEPQQTAGLKAAQPSRLVLGAAPVPKTTWIVSDGERLQGALTTLYCADLVSIALGMANRACRHAVELACTRSRFSGRFRDEAGRDSIGKFGAVKKTVAEMESRRFLLETLAYNLTPPDPSSQNCAEVLRAKVVAAEALGLVPGGLMEGVGRVCRAAGSRDDATIGRFLRDAPLLRHLAEEDPCVLAGSYESLVSSSWSPRPTDDALLTAIGQRNALQPEVDALHHAWDDLASALPSVANSGDSDARDDHTLDKARCALRLEAIWRVLLRVHARLEAGLDAERALELLNVLAGELSHETAQLRRRAEAAAEMQRWDGLELADLRSRLSKDRQPLSTGRRLDDRLPESDLQPHRLSGAADSLLGPQHSVPALMGNLLADATDFARRRWDRLPPWVARHLEEMHHTRQACESLVSGLYWRSEASADPGASAPVLGGKGERALARLYISEAFCGLLDRAEDVYGLVGRPRLARTVNNTAGDVVPEVAAGPSDVRRFFILRDLLCHAGSVGPNDETDAEAAVRPDPLAHYGEELASRLQQAKDRFGEECWLNPNLQPSLFPLADAAARLQVLEAVLARRAHPDACTTTEGQGDPAAAGDTAPQPLVSTAPAGLPFRLEREIESALASFDRDFDDLCHGLYPPVIRAAELTFAACEATGETRSGARPPKRPGASTMRVEPGGDVAAVDRRRAAPRGIRILVVLEPRLVLAPVPVLRNGRLAEAHYQLDAAGAAALEQALSLSETCGAHVTVAAVASAHAEMVLREALALGAHEALLVAAPAEPIEPVSASAALAQALAGRAMHFDVVLGREKTADSDEGVLPILLAAHLVIPWYGTRDALWLEGDRHGAAVRFAPPETNGSARALEPRRVPLPAACALPAYDAEPREFTIDGWLRSLHRPLHLEPWPREVVVRPCRADEAVPAAHAIAIQSSAAAEETRQIEAHSDTGAIEFHKLEPVSDEADFPLAVLPERCTLAVVATDRHGRLRDREDGPVLDAAAWLAGRGGAPLAALVLTPPDEQAHEAIFGELSSRGFATVLALVHRDLYAENAVLCRRVLQTCWPLERPFRTVVAASWATELLATLAWAAEDGLSSNEIPQLVTDAVRLTERAGALEAAVRHAQGRLVRLQHLDLHAAGAIWISVAAGCEVPVPPALERTSRLIAQRCDLLANRWSSHEPTAETLRTPPEQKGGDVPAPRDDSTGRGPAAHTDRAAGPHAIARETS